MSSSTSDRAIRRGLLALACTASWLASGCGSSGSSDVSTFSVGGTVSGLAAGAQLRLMNNGTHSLRAAGGGTFAFPTALPSASHYLVTVASAPGGQTCTVSGGSGTIVAANVANIVVTCSDRAFHLGGAVRGLNASGLVLQNGADTLNSARGQHQFHEAGSGCVYQQLCANGDAAARGGCLCGAKWQWHHAGGRRNRRGRQLQ